MSMQFTAISLIACLSLPLGAAPAATASSTISPSTSVNYTVKKGDSVCGLRVARQLTNPAKIDYEKVMNTTPQMRRMKSDGIAPDSARGLQLRTSAAELIRTVCTKLMHAEKHCSIWKGIKAKDGTEVSDLTGAISRKILLMSAKSTYGRMKLERVSFGRSPEYTSKKLKIELSSYSKGGMLRIGGGYATVNARWRKPEGDAWTDTQAVLEGKSVDAINVWVCDEAKVFGLSANFLIPVSLISETATEAAMVPVTYMPSKIPGNTLIKGFAPLTCIPRTNLADALWAISGTGDGFDETKPYAMSYWDEEKGLQLAYLTRADVDLVIEANYEAGNLERALTNWEDEIPD